MLEAVVAGPGKTPGILIASPSEVMKQLNNYLCVLLCCVYLVCAQCIHLIWRQDKIADYLATTTLSPFSRAQPVPVCSLWSVSSNEHYLRCLVRLSKRYQSPVNETLPVLCLTYERSVLIASGTLCVLGAKRRICRPREGQRGLPGSEHATGRPD